MGSMSFVSDDVLIHTNMDMTILEIHQLSYFYHWGREECWNTPCTQRGVFIDQIKQQLKAERGASKGSPKKPSNYRESK